MNRQSYEYQLFFLLLCHSFTEQYSKYVFAVICDTFLKNSSHYVEITVFHKDFKGTRSGVRARKFQSKDV